MFGNFGDFMTLPFGVDIRRHFANCEFFPVKFEMFFFPQWNQIPAPATSASLSSLYVGNIL